MVIVSEEKITLRAYEIDKNKFNLQEITSLVLVKFKILHFYNQNVRAIHSILN